MATLDNANPTILSASQLPTRQAKLAPRKGPESRYNDIVFAKPSYLSQPFCSQSAVAWPRTSDWHDEFADEAIDEQEIYGMSISFCLAILVESRLEVFQLETPHYTISATWVAYFLSQKFA